MDQQAANATLRSYLWLDYETTGSDARRDRPTQFAALRTDAELREVGEPLVWFCQPALDCVPDPVACLITGHTPQRCLQEGLPEHRFASQIHAALSQPGTVGVGFNSMRFDDEVSRFLFWRNLFDPYSREWRNDCGRWDMLDVLRLARALRPDGITWPVVDGKPSLKLVDLSAANGIAHRDAHDALADVRATVELARRLRAQNQRLYDFALALRRKERVLAELGLPCAPADARPFLHVSGRFATERGNLALMWPLATHPRNRNEIIAWDLAQDPRELADLKPEQIRQRLFVRSEDLPVGQTRLALKSVHVNKSPMVVGNLKALTPQQAERWGLDMAQQLQHAQWARGLPDLSTLWAEVYATPQADDAADVDHNLYGAFVGDADRRRLDALRVHVPLVHAQVRQTFDDPRLAELVFRYCARNFPETLTPVEQARWEQHRAARLLDGAGSVRTVETALAQIDALSENADERGEVLLGELADWLTDIAPSR